MGSKRIVVEQMSKMDNDIFDDLAETPEEYDVLTKAENFAIFAHEGAKRKDGKSPYIVHPERVVKLLQKVGVTDPDILAAAWLHDVIENTGAKIEGVFPSRVVRIVKELTKEKGGDKIAYLEGLRNASWESILIKMADRYDNILDGATTFGQKWMIKYLQGADIILKIARDTGAIKRVPGAKLYTMLKDLRDRQLASSAPVPAST